MILMEVFGKGSKTVNRLWLPGPYLFELGWKEVVQVVALPKMKRMKAKSPVFVLSFPFSSLSFLLPDMFVLGPCMCMSCVQPKEAESIFPFVTWATALVYFFLSHFIFLLSRVCYLILILIYLMYAYISFLIGFCMIQFPPLCIVVF